MMPGQIPDPSVTAGSLPGLGPLTGLPSSALTAEELKYADIRNIGAMIAPLHFLEVKLGKRPQPVKSELDEEEERRKRRREKNKVAAARCRNKKKERTEFLQRVSRAGAGAGRLSRSSERARQQSLWNRGGPARICHGAATPLFFPASHPVPFP
uniref:jun dimerization protein 2 n=1 Tax=Halichoerus grypus TaxID=9711 RepID=UPI0016592E90|nr:jun dimerization protein 2 [Halichoerus grypus]XP_035928670.1 jun dimerization protein 2 [Halichoerus grypus]XP_035928671.1 jun dimerization protein 2 [Halichoerus grypus]XP_035928672.1 jun dimerization protein 2 [Halichoerus grypus]XP_035928673.1 jun dimerization protein 2 [Halichoerus grypus]XP_035928674.1 jun dimerization protein 2 [Halichoerus grypus]